MEKGSYKRLLVKLSGAGLGLAVMLGAATMMARDFHSDIITSAELSSHSKSLSHQVNRDFDIITETGGADAKSVQPSLSLQSIKMEHFERLMGIRLSTVETISETIEEISYKAAIPSALKENILFNLQLQLQKAEKNLQETEVLSVIFSHNDNPSLMNLSKSDGCDNEDIILLEKCEGQCATGDSELDEKRRKRNTTEAFFWI
ncbi:hypothetical protein MNBD_ALPHA03-601 [hydrothermal vent metagenome]|uniref:Uncharacterized protein n=1 Tax=hydrothermal vent metagenome TaxID=652676 RepID=A0A3B1ADS3_9ZZZZ